MGSLNDPQFKIFSPFTLRGVTFRNRIGVPPMAMCMAKDGVAEQEWGVIHYGKMSQGGAGLIIVEATAVEPAGRITSACMGLYNDECVDALKPITHAIKKYGARACVQLAHAGRKGSLFPLWEKRGAQLTIEQGGWETLGSSPVAFEGLRAPRALTTAEVDAMPAIWANAAKNAVRAGFEAIEIHAAHGYLIHSFLSSLANQRTDSYGGSFDNRIKLLRNIVRAIREVIPTDMPLLVRLSTVDWVEGGWTCDDTVYLAKLLHDDGVDLIDCSTGGIVIEPTLKAYPGYQVPFAEKIRRESGMPTSAVGLITDAGMAADIIRRGQADLVLVGREILRNPNWPNMATRLLQSYDSQAWPTPYNWSISWHK